MSIHYRSALACVRCVSSLPADVKAVQAREKDLKAQGQTSTLAVERLRGELEESQKILSDLQARPPPTVRTCPVLYMVLSALAARIVRYKHHVISHVQCQGMKNSTVRLLWLDGKQPGLHDENTVV